MKRTATFQWAGKSITYNKNFEMPYEVDAKRVTDKYREHDNLVHERKIVHRFQISDVDDPEVYAAQPILDWQKSEHGQWIMEYGLDPTYHFIADPATYAYQVTITAHITPKRWTEYCLRFDKHLV